MSAPTKDGFEGFMEPFQEPVCPIPRSAEVVEALTPVEGISSYVWRLSPSDPEYSKDPVGVEMVREGERISIIEPSSLARPRLKKSEVRAIMQSVARTNPIAMDAVRTHMQALEARIAEDAKRIAELKADRQVHLEALRPFGEALMFYGKFAEHQLILLSEDNPKGRRLGHLFPEQFSHAHALLSKEPSND